MQTSRTGKQVSEMSFLDRYFGTFFERRGKDLQTTSFQGVEKKQPI